MTLLPLRIPRRPPPASVKGGGFVADSTGFPFCRRGMSSKAISAEEETVMDAWIWSRRRSGALREQLGPEYDKTVDESGGRRSAESELKERVDRRQELDIRPLAPAAADRYADEWRDVQARFVDSPGAAVGEADRLVIAVLRERGYPMDDFDQRAADISVDHADVVENYRAAHGISLANDQDHASTEDLRQAMVHYRTLFERLLERETSGPTDTREQVR